MDRLTFVSVLLIIFNLIVCNPLKPIDLNSTTASPVTGSTSTTIPSPNWITWNSKEKFMYGLNYAWNNYGTDFGYNNWGNDGVYDASVDVMNEFQDMATNYGVKVIRWFIFTDGRGGILMDGMGVPTGLQSDVQQDVGALLSIAENLDVYVIPTLFDFYLMHDATSSGGVNFRGHTSWITSASDRLAVMNNVVKPFVQIVENHAYKNRVIAYDIINEPEWCLSDITSAASCVPATRNQMRTFAMEAVTAIKSISPNALVTLGSATMWWVQNWTGLGLDFYTVHYYGWMEATLTYQTTKAALGLDKPVLMGEFPGGYETSPAVSATGFINTFFNNGYAGALGWDYRGGTPLNKLNPQPSEWKSWATSHSGDIDF